jgi:serine protease
MRLVRPLLALAATGGLVLAGSSFAAAPAPAAVPAHAPRFLPTVTKALATAKADSPLTPPAPPCPLPPGVLPPVPDSVPVVGGTTVGPCIKLPEFPAAGQPNLGNMAYWGGRVQVHPRVYLVYLGWGRRGAFKDDCTPSKLVEGKVRATLKCDPDGAGKRMADFVYQLGGTEWAGVQSQFYQVVNGVKTYISNDKNQLGGIWVDDVTPTSAKISYHDMAAEAQRAVKHFRIPAKALMDSNIVIAQPQNFSDPQAEKVGYCAFHDLIRADVDPKDYKGLTTQVPYTNMPYVLNQGSNCGEHMINSGAIGRLDAFTLALGHEIEETVTDPGAEDVIGQTPIGGWYDPLDGNENGDKCAYVGLNPLTGGSLSAMPGRGANIRGNRGGTFAVQSLWSNNAAAGVGYCAGAGTDLPF